MDCPAGDPEEMKSENDWLLAALDRKFAEQEKALHRLLDQVFRRDLNWGSERNSEVLLEREPMWEVQMEVKDLVAVLPSPYVEAKVSTKEDVQPKSSMKATRRHKSLMGTQVMREKWEPDPPLQRFVKGPLDGYMGMVVVVNLIFMIIMTQWTGSQADVLLGISTSSSLNLTEHFFEISEYVFFVLFVLDVMIRVWVLRREWIFDHREGFMYLNVFDACVVFVNAFELLVLPLLFLGNDQEQHANSIRVIKLLRIVRTLRIVKTVTIFRQLRLLVGTCIASIGALFWSMVLLMVLKVGFALIICQALQGYVLDDQQDLDTRLLVNKLYGDFGKAFYTMFEVTHSGSWPGVVRPVVDNVDALYAIPFLTYITLVVFAVIRIVTALFLKETLASAANDADMVMEDNRRMARDAQNKLEELFRAADDDGDGHLTKDEFAAAMSLPSVQGFLTSLDVSVRDCHPLFDILDDGDGLITTAEFCKGLMQLKGQARALDIFVLQRENAKLMKECQDIQRSVLDISESFRGAVK
ncbi:Scn11a [Symbiodinium sp. CCMP2456]|nr:Scn11a [Symbiodinium sp. CCMP2456]